MEKAVVYTLTALLSVFMKSGTAMISFGMAIATRTSFSKTNIRAEKILESDAGTSRTRMTSCRFSFINGKMALWLFVLLDLVQPPRVLGERRGLEG